MNESHGTFATAITCIDGRAIEPVMHYLREHFAVEFIDTVTKAGLDGRLHTMDAAQLEELKKEVMVSVTKHGSKAIAVQGHDQCAGNPVSEQQHTEDLQKDVAIVESWNLGIPAVGLWVAPKEGVWVASKVV
jgi:hypothetical protein